MPIKRTWKKLNGDNAKLIVAALRVAARNNYEDADACEKRAQKAVDRAEFLKMAQTMRKRGEECFDLAEAMNGAEMQYRRTT